MSCCAEHQVLTTGSSYLFNVWSSSPFLTSLLLGPIVLAIVLVYPALVFFTPQEKHLDSSAFQYVTADDPSKRKTLPKLVEIDAENEEIQLSIVIPAFNEKDRLPVMLDEAVAFLETLKTSKKSLAEGNGKGKQANGHSHTATETASKRALVNPLQSIEFIIVDDGSRDSTARDVLEYAKKNKLDTSLRLVQLGQNCGKGRAVRHGVLHARGALIAFCDADGATRFSDLGNLAKEMDRIITPAGYAIVCGSRNHLVQSEAVVKRSFARNFLMHSFHLVLKLLMRPPNPAKIVNSFLPNVNFFAKSSTSKRNLLPVQPPIRDTQCGFKLFTRRSAQAIFPLAHIDRWIFDVELLLLAEVASSNTLQRTAASNPSLFADSAVKDPLLRLPLPISEVAVDWREVEGSKIDILKDSIRMGLDLLIIRLNYAFGRWKGPGILPGVESMSGKEKVDSCCK
ncbi:uncharacterized protein FA14DRAFT_138444 [Meira miltonrushii]|uniref:dolichyl-phosphate beta-glucosyltransferase n=1 Tax=Meira miltonrushii TaxID=1280837 RepID=A0A316V6W4_9BASI|nr:uncharacterized protein FA14DRAFT_138444 [Meira miltonrushii]PWN31943.1 hypothetical protein FA14DRAFT_138444 [Meira miltonrushii]